MAAEKPFAQESASQPGMNFRVRAGGLACCAVLLLGGCRKTGNGGAVAANPLGLSADDRAMQAKLQPVIECINDTLEHFQKLRPVYRRRLAAVAQHADEGPAPDYISFKAHPYEQNAQFSRDCAAGLAKAADMAPRVQAIDAPAKDASQALLALIQPGADMEAYFAQKAYLNDTGAQRARQLDAQVSPLLDRIVRDADTLDDAVQQQEAGLRQRELDAIEKKYGRNLTWHTRHSIMAARSLNDNLIRLARSNQLTAQTVAGAEQPLQSAYDDASAWVRAHPDAGKPTADGATPMWFQINGTLSHELGNANELRQYLATARPDPETVRYDIGYITSDFNSLVQTYNQMQQNHVSTD